MGRKYQNPPLVEAVCEFRFNQDTKWDLTFPGLLSEQIKDQYPIREQRPVQEIVMIADAQQIRQETVSSNLMVFLNQDRSSFVQTGTRQVSIHHVQPYPTWSMVLPNIEQVYQSVAEVTTITGLDRIGLRYINRIEGLEDPSDVDELFNFRLHIGNGIPTLMLDFIAGALLDMGNRRDTCRVQLANAPAGDKNTNSFLLDLDYALRRPGLVAPDGAIAWVKEAHDHLESIFESCLTDRLRAIFQEIK